ncbi:hypothetical protein HPB48_014615 [Haemaphysalis longicornis]|uniref:Uncharacterized protein n=1 Tax=Haemaphysalis longicornis TaxID=44386 RepID=A0A9J6FBY6_HAELO|nr:hypothetical protein HPB48_014615 [Haemaphysalis longicornis]
MKCDQQDIACLASTGCHSAETSAQCSNNDVTQPCDFDGTISSDHNGSEERSPPLDDDATQLRDSNLNWSSAHIDNDEEPPLDDFGDCDATYWSYGHNDDEEPPPAPGCAQEDPDVLSPYDIMALTVNFAVQFGLPWRGGEALQKLICYILRRKDVPGTKHLFKKFVGAGIEAARFHFYCDECMASISETSGRLVERNSQEGQCRECGKPYSGREMMRDGQFFVSLPLQRQLTSQLADKEVASALLDRLNVINQNPGEVESKADMTDGDMYRRIRKEISEHDLTLTLMQMVHRYLSRQTTACGQCRSW